MNKAIQEFLKAILVSELSLQEIKEKAYDLVLADREVQPQNLINIFSATAPAWGAGITQSQFNAIKAEYEEGRKIQAIKLLREATSWGLKESKDWVESRGWYVPPSQRW